VISVPKCGCSERSSAGQVFTCPECVRAALLCMDGHRVDQGEMFDDLDSRGSVSALDEDEDGLVPIQEVLRSLQALDDLPF